MEERRMEPEELIQQLLEQFKRMKQKGLEPILFVISTIAVLLWAGGIQLLFWSFYARKKPPPLVAVGTNG